MRFVPWWLGVALVAVVVAVVAAFAAQADQRTQVAMGIAASVVAALLIIRRVRRPRIRDWRDAETAAARWLRKAGCRRVSLTGGSADGGIDVVTAEWAVQVKHTTKRVGRPAVQQLVGAALTLDRLSGVVFDQRVQCPSPCLCASNTMSLCLSSISTAGPTASTALPDASANEPVGYSPVVSG